MTAMDIKKVARLLETNFRSTDYPARIGGDEFAVILTEITPEKESLILEKITSINEILLNPVDDLPAVSLSSGSPRPASYFLQKAPVRCRW